MNRLGGIRVRPWWQPAIFRFLLASGLICGLNLGVTVTLHEVLGASAEAAFATALAAVYVASLALLRWYVFPGQRRSLAAQAAGFAATSLLFRSLEFCAFVGLHCGAGVPYLVAAVGVMGGSFLTKYAFYSSWLFAPAPVEGGGLEGS